MKTVNIHTDGGCSGNQHDTNVGGWGAVLEYNGNRKELFGGELNTTNNRMELMALIKGLEALKSKDLAVQVFSDSAYVINCFQQGWYHKWRINNWRNSKKEPVENKELWERLLASVESISNISFYSVKGHLDINKTSDVTKWFKKFNSKNDLNYTREEFIEVVKMNHVADELANCGIKQAKETMID